MRAAAGVLFVAASTGRVLLAARSPWRRHPGTWETFGGSVEPGEAPRAAAAREVREEAGVVVAPGDLALLGVALFRDVEYALFRADAAREFDPALSHEHHAAAWFDPARPPEPLHPGLVEALASLTPARTGASPRRRR